MPSLHAGCPLAFGACRHWIALTSLAIGSTVCGVQTEMTGGDSVPLFHMSRFSWPHVHIHSFLCLPCIPKALDNISVPAGTVPSDLCSLEAHSPLSDIFLDNNMLTGTLNVSACLNLILLEASSNNLSGTLYGPQGYNHLHTILLGDNEFNMTSTLDGIIAGKRVTEITMANNRHDNFDYTARTGQFERVRSRHRHTHTASH